jgi:hypothetical protein
MVSALLGQDRSALNTKSHPPAKPGDGFFIRVVSDQMNQKFFRATAAHAGSGQPTLLISWLPCYFALYPLSGPAVVMPCRGKAEDLVIFFDGLNNFR